ncbi:hypothetical protein ABEG10_38210 (plasmid) [Burkholderia cenocepacia]|nr:hypothetical protein [Burkholderia cenocepacia]MCO8415114.1 hypothetical protein [Burkholderia cenocepacia]MCO8423087.1 hypothetical protein [Burkholderia cenocepacia]MCO8474764.1 hypothetical protein [Burkholderia cenocepacia]MCO8482056.1 hypothetical protein [Burkholderia cenocepacia]MCO8488707.1 hypothetical protein [Burkholderia cenocepacia]
MEPHPTLGVPPTFGDRDRALRRERMVKVAAVAALVAVALAAYVWRRDLRDVDFARFAILFLLLPGLAFVLPIAIWAFFSTSSVNDAWSPVGEFHVDRLVKAFSNQDPDAFEIADFREQIVAQGRPIMVRDLHAIEAFQERMRTWRRRVERRLAVQAYNAPGPLGAQLCNEACACWSGRPVR